MTVLLTFVIPAFEGMFAEFGGGAENLPWLTRLLIAISKGFVSYLPFLIVAVVGAVVGITYVNRQPVDSTVLANNDQVQIGKFRLVFLTG